MSHSFLIVDPEKDVDVLKGLASPVRVKILSLLNKSGPQNINDISDQLGLPQSSISSNVQLLEECGLIKTESRKARKGSQKICHIAYDELVILFKKADSETTSDDIEVSMPLGLYTNCDVTGPCGLCSPEGIIGLLDVPQTFLDPERMKAALLWFTSGFVEYQFPNNAKLIGSEVESLEFNLELSSEVPGTEAIWPSDITVSINGLETGSWTSPGDFGDKRGIYTPRWWKLKGSQYGLLKRWTINSAGTFLDGIKISEVPIQALELDTHRSIRLKIAVKPDAHNPGGVNIFGRGFGNHDQDITMRIKQKVR